jgi:acyl carrier protein
MSEHQGSAEMRSIIREYVLGEFLPDEDPSVLEDSTPLISSGILDSIANAKLVTFLEEQFHVRFKPNEITVNNLDTIDLIVGTVERKARG